MSLSSRFSRKNKKQEIPDETEEIISQLDDDINEPINLFADENITYGEQLLSLLSVKAAHLEEGEAAEEDDEAEGEGAADAAGRKKLRPKKPGKRTAKVKKNAPAEEEPTIEEPTAEEPAAEETAEEQPPEDEAPAEEYGEEIPLDEDAETKAPLTPEAPLAAALPEADDETELEKQLFEAVKPKAQPIEAEPREEKQPEKLFHQLDYVTRVRLTEQSFDSFKRTKRKIALRRIGTLALAVVLCAGLAVGVKTALNNGVQLPFANFAALENVEPEIAEGAVSHGYGAQAELNVVADEENIIGPADKSIWSLILCNVTHALPTGYEQTVTYITPFPGVSQQQCDARIEQPLKDMFAAAEADGIYLYFRSGYRSFETQTYLFEAMKQDYIAQGMSEADALAATKKLRNVPGTSEHETGLAVDLVPLSNITMNLTAAFAQSAEAKWLLEHCAEYGFILRYPEDKTEITGTSFEPWHFRYVGIEDAKKIMAQSICLEEYLGEADN